MNKMKKGILIGAVSLVAVAAAVGFGVYSKVKKDVDAMGDNVIYNGIKVEGLDLSGKTVEEGLAALEAQLLEQQAGKVILTGGETQVETTLGELGLQMANADEILEEALSYGKEGTYFARYRTIKKLAEGATNLDVTYKLDETVAGEALTTITAPMNTEAQDATITRKDGAFVVTDEMNGVEVDVPASVAELVAYFNEAWEYTGDESFEVVFAEAIPAVTKEELSKVKDLLGSFSTSFTAGNDRAKNIANATSRINGSVLMPGEELSVSTAMGSRTAANGYYNAGTYQNGKVVDGLGGGVCQVSTTVYGAVLNAELEVTERHGHSMTVGYVKPAQDAAISEGYKDLKFKNNTEAPIYIEGYVSGGTVTYKIYGAEYRATNRKVEYVSNTLSTTPATNKFVEAPGKALGVSKSESGHDGKKAELWKVVYVDGKEVSRERVNSTSYMMSPATYSVGTSSSDAEASAIVRGAISSNDLATIQGAVSQAKALVAAKEAAASAPETNTEVTE